jgi:serine/threonine protein phosphatase PrpC
LEGKRLIPGISERNFASEQLLGADPDCTVQQDRVLIETVKTASGVKVLLGVVADGDGHAMAGEAARIVIRHVLEAVRSSKEKDLNAVLTKGLLSGNQTILGEGSQVAVTALAVRGNRYHLASAGHTSAFLIHEGRVRLLNPGTNHPLGLSGSPQIQTNASNGDLLNPGDQIVLASDALTRINLEDGKPFVDPKDLPAYVEGNSPREAARHIVSIAMGRDVDDNLSVIVIQTPGKRQGGPKLWILAAAFVALVLLGALIVLGLNRDRTDEMLEPVDHGYSVVLSGSVFVVTGEGEGKPVEKLGTIPPLAEVEAQEPAHLRLQSAFDSSTDVPLTSIYLSSGSKIKILSVDAYLDKDGQGRGFQSFPTSLTTIDGSVLLLRESGARKPQIGAMDIVASLTGSGRAIIGVRSIEGEIHVDCLLGGCAYEGKTGEITSLPAGQMLIRSQQSGEPHAIFPLPPDIIGFWNDLCESCLSTH